MAAPKWVADSEHVDGARAAILEGDLAGLKKLGLRVNHTRPLRSCMVCRRRTETSNHGAAICFGCGQVFATDPWPATS